MQQNQVLETKQKLAFTQDLRQSLAILKMPFAELETHISQQIFDNCLLEQEDISSDNADNPEENTDTETFSLDDLVSQEVVRNDQNTESEYFEADLIADSMQHPTNITITGQNIYEHLQTLAPSLHEHLTAQFNLTARTDKKSMLAEFLIGSIDEDGYLRCEISDAANICAVSVAETEGMVKLIQTFEPFGVGARNLRECLLIQLGLLQEYLTAVKGFQRQFLDLTKIIIENYLQDIAEAKLQKIAHHLKCPVVDIQSAVDLIKTFDPKPGRNFGDQKDIGYILPDVKIRNLEHDYLIMINEPANAKLFISPLYRNLIQNREYAGSDVIKYLRTKQNAALNLMRSIDERKKTLYQITRAIIDRQRDFFEKGPLYLKPLTLHQIADVVELHESTVSRAIAEKYMDTERGIFPFKYFFSSGLDSTAGETVSATNVKDQLKAAIIQEDVKAPLSDEQLTEVLKMKGIHISHRTVSKYREELMIPSSAKRRRY